ncbi:hypothetical protein R1sor_014035 [Riccia sorocarpa]|uniref:Ribosome recycling factor domain-containing protein n=1 Tax=Riccia sorocarpa TaxID=122646 RepID=A0ABD3HA38_9MARC
MRRSKFVYRALLQCAASRAPRCVPAPCCGCGTSLTTVREILAKSSFLLEVNPAPARHNRPEIFGGARDGRDLGAEQVKRWNPWPSAAAGLILGAATLPQLAHNEEDSSGRRDEDDGLRSSQKEKTDMEKVLLHVRKAVGERLDALKLRASSLPSYNISAKGQQVSIRFTVAPSCDVSHLIVDMVNRLGRRAAGPGGDGEITIQANDSTVARQLILTAPELSVQRESIHLSDLEDKRAREANKLCVLMFEPLIGDIRAIEVEFLKKGFLTANELDGS